MSGSGRKMIINAYKSNNYTAFSKGSKKTRNNVNFTSAPVRPVVNSSFIKKILPTIAFASSTLGSVFYLVGGTGLYYDLYKEKQAKKQNLSVPNSSEALSNSKYFYSPKEQNFGKHEKDEGVKTIEASTKFGKIGINCAKMAIFATSAAGMACGLGEGIPLMALGEATNLGSASIIQTPVGTGLFGIGIASVFAGLALDNTPELKLNDLDLMAAKGFSAKSELIWQNTKSIAKEIGTSIVQIVKNIFNPKFYKENFFQIKPKMIVFSEKVNKEGKIIIERSLRHNKNYLTHAASFTLAIGGLGLVITKLLNLNKAQRASLGVEEGGFVFDNLGMTRYGLDKLTTNGRSAGASFAIGGAINAVSQFIGLDNKEGRALQWFGISGVFLGFAIDRGKHLKEMLKLAKERPELTRTIREWKLKLPDYITDKKELKKVLEEIRNNKPITNEKIRNFEDVIRTTIGEAYQDSEKISKELQSKLEEPLFKKLVCQSAKDYNQAVEIIKICTEKIFGSL